MTHVGSHHRTVQMVVDVQTGYHFTIECSYVGTRIKQWFPGDWNPTISWIVTDQQRKDCVEFCTKRRDEAIRTGLIGEWDDLATDEGVTLHVLDSEMQEMVFRVGPVFGGKGVIGNGLWVEYQEIALGSDLHGPILLSKETWDWLKSRIDERFGDDPLD